MVDRRAAGRTGNGRVQIFQLTCQRRCALHDPGAYRSQLDAINDQVIEFRSRHVIVSVKYRGRSDPFLTTGSGDLSHVRSGRPLMIELP